MICPSCNNTVSDTAVICDQCNAILDASFLGDDITNDASAEAAPVEQETRIKPMAQVASSRAKKSAPKPTARPAGAAAAALYAEPEESTAAGSPKRSLDEIAAVPQDTTEALEDFVRSYKALPQSERITATGVGLMMLSLALPWRGTKEDGDLIGLMAGGWPVLILAFLVGSAVFLRRHEKLRPFKEYVLQGALGAAGLSFLFCGFYVKSALVVERIRAGGHIYNERRVWPEFGVFLGLIAAAVMVGGTVKSYMARRTLPD